MMWSWIKRRKGYLAVALATAVLFSVFSIVATAIPMHVRSSSRVDDVTAERDAAIANRDEWKAERDEAVANRDEWLEQSDEWQATAEDWATKYKTDTKVLKRLIAYMPPGCAYELSSTPLEGVVFLTFKVEANEADGSKPLSRHGIGFRLGDYIVTAKHVIEASVSDTIVAVSPILDDDSDAVSSPLEVVYVDALFDFAVLAIENVEAVTPITDLGERLAYLSVAEDVDLVCTLRSVETMGFSRVLAATGGHYLRGTHDIYPETMTSEEADALAASSGQTRDELVALGIIYRDGDIYRVGAELSYRSNLDGSGNSGSPLFMIQEGELRVVGLVTAGDGQVNEFAVHIKRICERTAWAGIDLCGVYGN